MTAGRPGHRGRAEQTPLNRALCCSCGDVRTVAHRYRRRLPDDLGITDATGPWCAWLRCAHCGEATLHAVIVEALAEEWRVDGCDRERHDRAADRSRRRTSRRLDALAAEGVTIVRAASADEMTLNDALVEVIEYADARSFLIRVCTSAQPERLLEAVEIAEELLDSPDQLGSWADDAGGLWRGLAITEW